ncbi:GatB/YqeY domain-containing protein [Balneolaceae bacterium ANBcel3]|nr:GatB/YqeY domain-containing protein [Balneolaceae bacterium ANBcel3]
MSSSTYSLILSDLKEAMKSKDASRLQLLRSLKSKILEKEISERKGSDVSLNEEQVIEVLMKAAKQRKDSIQQFQDAGRDELAKVEEYELSLIEAYLPKMLSEEEISDIVRQVVKETGATGPSDMGKVMGKIMPKLKGKADGALINKLVKQELSPL